jgi:putative addiction module component (TIGR02574 family)
MISMPEIQKLSVSERLDLLENIWESLTLEDAVPELTDQQKLEIDKRLAAHDANPSRGRSWSEARERLARSS